MSLLNLSSHILVPILRLLGTRDLGLTLCANAASIEGVCSGGRCHMAQRELCSSVPGGNVGVVPAVVGSKKGYSVGNKE